MELVSENQLALFSTLGTAFTNNPQLREFHPLCNGEMPVSTVLKSQRKKNRRKAPAGISTNDLIFSAHAGNNSELFPQILALYIRPGSRVADVTYGKGVFWKNAQPEKYKLLTSDLATGTDCRALPYHDASVDCVVLDPPYMHTPGGTAHAGHQNYEGYYRNNGTSNGTGAKYHEAVLALYFQAGKEAFRVLKPNGILIVKCADEVCANVQRLTHVELLNEYTANGFMVEDLFVLVRSNKPGVSRILRQVHARKNHSYFLVLRKRLSRTKNSSAAGAPATLQVIRQINPLANT